MFWASRAVLVNLIVPFALQQTTQPPPPATGSVEGIVVRADTHEPLKKAWVTMQKAEGSGKTSGALTDPAGKFVLKDIEPGRYRLMANRNGFVRWGYGDWGRDAANPILSVSSGQTIRDIRVTLTPAAVISGRVYDDDADPVANARVMAMRFIYREGKREPLPLGSGETNDLGEYRIFGLSPGSYFVSAAFESWERPPVAAGAAAGDGAGEETGFAPTYYPGTNDLARAAPVELRAGEEFAGLDINLLSTRAVKVRGRILNTLSGKTELRAWVMLVPREAKTQGFQPSSRSEVKTQGEFEIRGVVPGSYTLIASVFGGEGPLQARVPLEVGQTDVDNLIVPVGKGADIHGKIRWEGNAPSAKDQQPRVTLVPRGDDYMMMGWRKEKDPDDSFTLRNMPDGDYTVRAWDVPEDCYLKSASLGGEDVLSIGVTISGGRVPGLLEVTLSCAAATVQGAVVGEQGNAIPGVTVVLVPESDRRAMPHLFKTTTTDQNGRYTLKGIAPGEYKAFAWDRIESGAYQDPEFLRRYESDGKPVTIGEGDKLEIQLDLIVTGKTQQ